MAELPISPGVEFAWKIAAEFALRADEQFIEPRHLLYGICSIEGLVANGEQSQPKRPEDAARLEAEWHKLNTLAQNCRVDLSSLRRTLREQRPVEAAPPESSQKRVISRSAGARRCFSQAAELATKLGELQLDLSALLPAVLEFDDPKIQQLAAGAAERMKGAFEAQPVLSKKPDFSISLDPHLNNLDLGKNAATQTLQILQTLDAAAKVEQPHPTSASDRLISLCELMWEFGTEGPLEPLLQKALDQLLRLLRMGERGALLIRDTVSGELLLKAHSPCQATPKISMTSAARAMSQKRGFVWNRGEDLSSSQLYSHIEAGIYVPLVVNDEAIGVICIDSVVASKIFGHEELLLVTALAHQLALAIAHRELKVRLKQNATVLERLLANFSPKVRTRLLQRAQSGRLRLGGERSVVSILCSDIRGFTKLSATMDTEEIVSMLNEYFAALTECIFQHDGTVDKFIGDAILAVFGSPDADPQHCQKAVTTGVEMQRIMEEVNKKRLARGEVTCQIGIGVHSGDVLHGFIGSLERMEYTIIGDAVNRASRYCAAAKSGELLISPEVHQRVWRMVEAEQIAIPTKHEGDLTGYRVRALRAPSA